MKFISVKQLVFITTLIIFVFLLRYPFLELPFHNDSGANAYHARMILQGDPLYSTHHPAHHLPGVYYTYVLAFLLFGDSSWSVKLLLIPWTIITAYFVYLIGSRLATKSSGMIAAFIFALLNSHLFLKGNSGETELFANLPISISIYLGIYLLTNRSNKKFFVLVGMLCSIAFLYKIVFIFSLVIIIFMILIYAWLHFGEDNIQNDTIARVLWNLFGFLIPILLVFGIFAAIGLLPRFLLVFSLGLGYVDQLTQSSNYLLTLLLPLAILALNNFILLLLCLAGALHVIKQIWRHYYADKEFSLIGLGVVFWFFISLIVAGITRTGWFHYQIIVLPPLSILAAWELIQIHYKIKARWKFSNRTLTGLPISLFIIATIFVSMLTNYQHYYNFILYKANIKSFDEFLLKDSDFEGSTDYNMVKIAEYINTRTTHQDFIYSWSNFTQIYYLADRRAPVDIIWPSYIEATSSYQQVFSHQTKYILVSDITINPPPDWFNRALEQSYLFETELGDHRIFRRIN